MTYSKKQKAAFTIVLKARMATDRAREACKEKRIKGHTDPAKGLEFYPEYNQKDYMFSSWVVIDQICI